MTPAERVRLAYEGFKRVVVRWCGYDEAIALLEHTLAVLRRERDRRFAERDHEAERESKVLVAADETNVVHIWDAALKLAERR